MFTLAVDEPYGSMGQLFRRLDLLIIERQAPAWVVGQVARRHAMEAAQPLPKALVVSIDILNMDGAAHPDTRAQVQRLVRDPCLHAKLR